MTTATATTAIHGHCGDGHDDDNDEKNDEERPLLASPPSPSLSSSPSSSLPSFNGKKPRRIGLLHLMGIIFFLVSGGPAGLEDAVRAAGPFPALVAIVVLPIIWALPQALMTAELSTMNDHNGGYVIWITRAFGPFAGWVNAYNSFLSNTLDLSLYPILFVDYIERMMPLTVAERWLLFMASITMVVVLNVRSLRVVGNAAVVMMVLVVAPYFVEAVLITADGRLNADRWGEMLPPKTANWGLFLNTVLWNFTGWDSVGTIAAEIESPGRIYPLAVTVSCVFITGVYATAVAVGVSISAPDWSLWKEGYLIFLSSTVSPVLGGSCLITSAISALGSFSANMGANARAIWCMAEFGWMPKFLGRLNVEHNAPVNAVLLQAICVLMLCLFSFEAVVAVSNLTNCMSLFCEFAAFLRMKIAEPNAVRPYTVPGGLWGAIFITVPKAMLLIVVMVVTDYKTWAIVLGANLVCIVVYFIVQPKAPKVVGAARYS